MGVSEFVAVLAGVLVFETLTGKLLLAETMAPPADIPPASRNAPWLKLTDKPKWIVFCEETH